MDKKVITNNTFKIDSIKHVLVVDDEIILSEFLKELLEYEGFQVTVEMDSRNVIKYFEKDPNQFDILITDQTMPNVTGAELIPQVLSLRDNIPIILCTGYSELIDERIAKNIGAKSFLSKPVDMNQLLDTMRNLLEHKVDC